MCFFQSTEARRLLWRRKSTRFSGNKIFLEFSTRLTYFLRIVFSL
ncbi:hypothetical protein OESDEN_24309 [Oesophagostomum dentatum]|uniref:Uncharacterized protein n=1 Tax=Oesophagostomum dentatum TaxID=61180 RepID=A0A0B1RXZ9_OESDE|nr:hypothetical protein OESDEN_24309 [Oesophagostomum dentatum]